MVSNIHRAFNLLRDEDKDLSLEQKDALFHSNHLDNYIV